MALNIPLNSRFVNTQIVRFDGVETFARWPQISYLSTKPIAIFTVTPDRASRLDLLSNDYYGTPDYWWAIMAYNQKTELGWPKAGDVVKIPDPVFVFSNE